MTFRGSISAVAQAAGLALLLTGIAWVAPVPAEAASAAAMRTKSAAPQVAATPVAAKEPETTGTVEKATGLEPNCAQSRRRLWVEGEGWIVRRVTTCF